MSKMNIAKKDRPKVKVECLRLLANLQLDPARTFFISGFVETYLRLNKREERVFQKEIATIQTVAEQERIMQLTNSWVEQGKNQGLVEGKSQGLEEERRSAISSLMQFRYGAIDSQLSAVLPVLVTLTSDEYTPLILQLSREELIDHCDSINN
jgi:flagellar biosynthesis/type III secretory pathway protein FliH